MEQEANAKKAPEPRSATIQVEEQQLPFGAYSFLRYCVPKKVEVWKELARARLTALVPWRQRSGLLQNEQTASASETGAQARWPHARWFFLSPFPFLRRSAALAPDGTSAHGPRASPLYCARSCNLRPQICKRPASGTCRTSSSASDGQKDHAVRGSPLMIIRERWRPCPASSG